MSVGPRVVLTVIFSLIAAAPGAQVGPLAPPRGDATAQTAVIRGRILTPLGRPAPRASVRLIGLPASLDWTETSDQEGRFEFRPPPGSYRLSASKPGYLTLDYGQRRAFERGTVLTLAPNQTLLNIDVTLPSGGAIAGRITDGHGDPLDGVNLRVLQSRFSGGTRRLLPVPGVGPRFTDDLGRYRLFGMPPGEYVVVASPTGRPILQPARNHSGYAPTYYPGVLMPGSAQIVNVGLSQTASGIDFALVTAAPARIGGMVVDSDDRPLAGTVALTTTDRWGGLAVAMQVRSTPEGAFQFSNVPPGEYTLQAIGPRPGDQRGEGSFAAMPLSVNGENIDGLRLQTSAGSQVAGRLVFETDSAQPGARPNPRDVVFVFAPTSADQAPSNDSFLHRWRPENDGTFVMTGLSGPRRLRLVSTTGAWTIRRVTAGGVDLTDRVISFGSRQESIADLEIVMTNRTASLTGHAVDDRERAVADYAVVAFEVDPAHWYPESRFVKYTRPRQDGTFSLPALPAGEYFVAAVDWLQADDLSGEWQDPAFLERLSRDAARMTLTENEQATATPRLIVR